MSRAAAKTSLHSAAPAGSLAGLTVPVLRLHEPSPDPAVVSRLERILAEWAAEYALKRIEAQHMETKP